MRAKSLAMALAVLLTLAGCAQAPSRYKVKGTVRNVWCHDSGAAYCDITFERDAGGMSVISVVDQAPVWAGGRFEIQLASYGLPLDRVEAARRIP